jgi:hypothetical protein
MSEAYALAFRINRLQFLPDNYKLVASQRGVYAASLFCLCFAVAITIAKRQMYGFVSELHY